MPPTTILKRSLMEFEQIPAIVALQNKGGNKEERRKYMT